MAEDSLMDQLGANHPLPQPPSNVDVLFTSAGDWWNNACLNYSRDEWWPYVVGYQKAADILVSDVEGRQMHQDSLVYPIVFLYRQYLELSMKDLIRQAHEAQGIPPKFPTTHDLAKLWRACEALLREVLPGQGDEFFEDIARLMDEFHKIDPLSTAFRYPTDRQGDPSLPGIQSINLRVIRDTVQKISMILGGAAHLLGELQAMQSEMRSDFA